MPPARALAADGLEVFAEGTERAPPPDSGFTQVSQSHGKGGLTSRPGDRGKAKKKKRRRGSRRGACARRGFLSTFNQPTFSTRLLRQDGPTKQRPTHRGTTDARAPHCLVFHSRARRGEPRFRSRFRKRISRFAMTRPEWDISSRKVAKFRSDRSFLIEIGLGELDRLWVGHGCLGTRKEGFRGTSNWP